MWFAQSSVPMVFLRGIEMKRRTVLVLAALFICVVAAGWWIRNELRIDSCLDNGGRWAADQSACVYR